MISACMILFGIISYNNENAFSGWKCNSQQAKDELENNKIYCVDGCNLIQINIFFDIFTILILLNNSISKH